MVTLGEVVRWLLYTVSHLYFRVAGVLMRRDRLVSGSERKFRALLEAAPDAMVIVNSHGHIALMNAQAERLFGYERRDLIGQPITELIPERFRNRHRNHQKHYLRNAGTRPMGSGLELYGVRSDGTEFPVEISLSPLGTDEGILISAAIRDITERKRDEARLRHLADHDDLTGLLNRRSFEQQLTREVALAQRHALEGSMVLIDIDGLKDVNDTLGHAHGDELIRNIAELVSSRLRDTDIVARIGGDEFGVLMPNTSAEDARRVAAELLASIRDHGMVLGAHRLQPSACAGIAGYEQGRADSKDVMVAADLALYHAKDRGRDEVVVYRPRPEEHQQWEVRATWSRRIRRGLDEELFVPFHQPIMSVADRTVSRYELLLRLLDDNGEPIAPGAFLPTAERTGTIREIDRRMTSFAIDLIAASEAAGHPVSYEVNLSARSLADRELPKLIARRIDEAGIDPSLLVFEITETAAVANMEQARDFANALRGFGCSFALDDFGAGFASFYYLKHIPLDALKIDGDFVRNLRTSQTDQLLVTHMAQIAASLGLYTIAEFVEDVETLEMLASYGVDAVQGYHIGRPVPAWDLTELTTPRLEVPEPVPDAEDQRGSAVS
jgi:diguanylate cyclase (GGDEF)-like protein/PAS domain S-box-containing protein